MSGMGLFDFIEQHHGIRAAAHLFGELPAFFVSHVARRRADHPRDRVLFHVLVNVDANHGAFVVSKEEFCERAPTPFCRRRWGREK